MLLVMNDDANVPKISRRYDDVDWWEELEQNCMVVLYQKYVPCLA
jgi:hypothetical protein